MKKLLLAAATAACLLSACGTAQTTTAPTTAQTNMQSQIERNKANVLAFYDLAFNQHQPQQAVARYIGNEYIQHNPSVADGGQAFIDVFAPFLQQHPQSRAEVKRVVAEGDLVVLHIFSRTSPQDRGRAIADIFRLDKNGKIVEHWDVVQPLPEQSANNNSMF
ncbi:nuclear transport factor 2 family protein [Uruburuella testudinis]|uniref:Nuclear transport factor 2 family protein n=1 Tax=Uruburuella testudinis TaxID=1282863 RepID=A0ABY4DS60_9NEIS|nr:nuclear transport factor 2 family protein [Uruburuella testudinis]UOO81860.1 nuclear transport factor 2 family protein [Uruburuella testudinis]